MVIFFTWRSWNIIHVSNQHHILDYEVVNYKECLVGPTMCEHDYTTTPTTTVESYFRRMGRQNIAMELLALKKKMNGRRYTPEIMKLHQLLRKMTVTKTTKTTKAMLSQIKKNTKKRLNTITTKSKPESNFTTWIIKKETVRIDGKLMMKIVKGITMSNQ